MRDLYESVHKREDDITMDIKEIVVEMRNIVFAVQDSNYYTPCKRNIIPPDFRNQGVS